MHTWCQHIYYLLFGSVVWCGVGHCPCSRNVSIIMFKQARSRLDTGKIFAGQHSTSDIFLATFQPVSLPSQLRLYWKCIDTLSHFVLPFSGPSIAMTFKKNCFDIIKWLCQMQCFHFYFLLHNLLIVCVNNKKHLLPSSKRIHNRTQFCEWLLWTNGCLCESGLFLSCGNSFLCQCFLIYYLWPTQNMQNAT